MTLTLINSALTNTTIPPILKEQIEILGENSLTARIIKLFCNVHDGSFKFPKLDWNDAFLEQCGYIGIHSSAMSYSIMWGIDPFDRLYVATKLTDTDQNERNNLSSQSPETGVETFFQRSSNDDSWVSGKLYGLHGRAILISGSMDDKDFALFQKLIKGEKINVKNIWNNSETKLELAADSSKEITMEDSQDIAPCEAHSLIGNKRKRDFYEQ